MEFDDSEEEPTVEQASGNSFEEIDKAVETATKPNVTNEECVHAGKVFSEMEGNELFNMIAERFQDYQTQNRCVDGIAYVEHFLRQAHVWKSNKSNQEEKTCCS